MTQKSKIVIRAAMPSDLPQLAQIAGENSKNPWNQAQLEQELGLEFSYMLLAEYESVTAGFINMHILMKTAHINEIAIENTYRRRGIGTNLVNICVEYAKREKCENITLECRKSNTGALEFYEKLGFEILGIRRRFYCLPEDDAVIMRISIKGEI